MTLRRLLLITLTAVLSVALAGCDLLGADDDDTSIVTSGVYVANQGNFGDGNGSVSLYNPDTEATTPNAIANRNSIVQSIRIRNERLYLVANSGGRLDVFSASDQSQLQQLTDFSGPRYLTFSDEETAFLTNQSFGSPSSVEVLDVNDSSLDVTESIEVPGTPEGITTTDNRVYAALGGFSDTTLVAAINKQAGGGLELAYETYRGADMSVLRGGSRLWKNISPTLATVDKTMVLSSSARGAKQIIDAARDGGAAPLGMSGTMYRAGWMNAGHIADLMKKYEGFLATRAASRTGGSRRQAREGLQRLRRLLSVVDRISFGAAYRRGQVDRMLEVVPSDEAAGTNAAN